MTTRLCGLLLLASSAVAASTLIAMRVETEALRADGDDTVLSIAVTIAPEDRARAGTVVWISGELSQGSEIVDRFDSRASIGRDGSTSIEKSWPPGSYELRIDVESTGNNATGFWKGRVLVPRLRPAPPAPTPAPAAEAPVGAPETPPPPAEPAAATEVEAIAAREEAAAEPAEPSGIAAMMAAAAARTPPPSADTAEAGTPPPQPPKAAPVTEEKPATIPETPAPAPPPRTAGMSTITVLVTDSANRPVTSLRGADFELRIGGKETRVEAVDGADSELLLGFAVDISSTMAELLPDTRRLLRQLAERAAGSGSSIFLVTAGESTSLALPPGSSAPDLGGQLRQSAPVSEVDLVTMLELAFAQFEGRDGRRVLVVLSGGGDISSKEQWTRVLDTVASSGIPVLVVAFDDGGMEGRTASRLRRTAESSGGKFYSLRNTDVLRLTLDHFAELIDASYVIGFESAQSGPQKLKVSTPNRGVEILHSKGIKP